MGEMAKKKNTRLPGSGKMIAEKHPSALRRGSMSFDEVARYAKTLEVLNGQIRAAMKDMEASGIRELSVVDGYTQFDRGVELVGRFLANLGRSIADERFGRS